MTRKNKFNNSKKEAYLDTFKTLISLDDDDCNLSERSKFNFSYFCCNQEHACSIDDWGDENVAELVKKLVEYSKKSLLQLSKTPIGSGRKRRNILENYKVFPANSNFTKPSNIPHQAEWSRIRLDGATRLIGFIIPEQYHGTIHQGTSCIYDKNTFYIVFIDRYHNFYLMNK